MNADFFDSFIVEYDMKDENPDSLTTVEDGEDNGQPLTTVGKVRKAKCPGQTQNTHQGI